MRVFLSSDIYCEKLDKPLEVNHTKSHLRWSSSSGDFNSHNCEYWVSISHQLCFRFSYSGTCYSVSVCSRVSGPVSLNSLLTCFFNFGYINLPCVVLAFENPRRVVCFLVLAFYRLDSWSNFQAPYIQNQKLKILNLSCYQCWLL